ncbi:DUF3397 domain-containing protein [Paenibacillus sp. GD4]|uniref:DUF3397 domain-containing protein n=1 Tax=Paenibacillus TaxID=44249 RepID=UPI002543313A|nr:MULTISPECIES: DUF3397 domain-containing protein [Paenibacillus]MDQ1912972.1 DUF3397 domain-containing protein [Paenibacillus sp. GD4]
MNALWDWLHQVYTMLAMVPFVAFLVTWFIVYWVCKDKKTATHLSMDVTTLFLIGSVAVMSNRLFQSGMLFWTVVLLFLVLAGLLGNLQTRIRGRVDMGKIAKTLSRLGFVVLSACYVVLLIIGIGKYMLA